MAASSGLLWLVLNANVAYFVAMAIAHWVGFKVPVLFIYYDTPYYAYQDKIISFWYCAHVGSCYSCVGGSPRSIVNAMFISTTQRCDLCAVLLRRLSPPRHRTLCDCIALADNDWFERHQRLGRPPCRPPQGCLDERVLDANWVDRCSDACPGLVVCNRFWETGWKNQVGCLKITNSKYHTVFSSLRLI